MGLIKAALGAAGGVLGDQWKEFIYCEGMPADVLMTKGRKRTSSQGRSSNTTAEDNVISNGSVIVVNNGQCMMIVEDGKVVDVCAEPGQYTYDQSSEPSLFTDGLNKDSVVAVFRQMGRRFTFGGDPGKDQRVYFFNTKEILGNKYGTPSEIPFRTVDDTTHLNLTVRIRCFGEYSYRITDPILFYTHVVGNESDEYRRGQIDSQLKSELLTALQPAFAKISAQRIDYTELPGRTFELADALNEVLSKRWRELRGIEIVSFGVNSVKANEEDEAKIQKIQMGMATANPLMDAGVLADAQSDFLRAAGSNEGGGSAMALMGMGMANATGNNIAGLFNQAQAMQAQTMQAPQGASAMQTPQGAPAPAQGGWDCGCGQKGNTGKFCINCGKPKPEPAAGWACPSCGTVNQGRFCMDCGAKNRRTPRCTAATNAAGSPPIPTIRPSSARSAAIPSMTTTGCDQAVPSIVRGRQEPDGPGNGKKAGGALWRIHR